MRYQVNFLLPLKVQKISYYFGLFWKILLANQFAGFFTFNLFDLLLLIAGVHCYIVLVLSDFFVITDKKKSKLQLKEKTESRNSILEHAKENN